VLSPRKAALGALLILVAGSLCAWAVPTPEDIARAIRQLGDDRFLIREKASKFLWSAGQAAESALNAAAKSSDQEVARRARRILERFKYGIYPDTPRHIVDLINEARAGDAGARQAAVKKLFALGRPGYTVVLKLAAAEENPDFRRTLFQQLRAEAPRLAGALLAEGNLDAVEDLLEKTVLQRETERGSSAAEAALCNHAAFLLLRGTLDKKIAQLMAAPEVPDPRTAEVLAYLHRAQGDRVRAFRAAEQAGDRHLQKWLLWEQSKWQELLDHHPPQAERKGREEIEVLGWQAAYQRLTGRASAFEKTVAEIRKSAATGKDASSAAWFSAEALLLNDRPQDAVDVLIEAKRYAAACEILKGQMRYREALALADKVKGETHKEVFLLETLRARTLYEVGEPAQALRLLARLGDAIKDNKEEQWAYQHLIRCEYKLGLKDLAYEHAASVFTHVKKNLHVGGLFYELFGDKSGIAEAWWKLLRQRFADEDLTATMKRLRAVMEQTLDRKELLGLTGTAADWIQQNRQLKNEEREQALHALAETCLAAGLEKQAQRYFEEAVEVAASPAALMRLADFLAATKQWPQAAALYGQAWEKNKQGSVPLFFRGWALAQAGHQQEGKRLMKLAHWLPLAHVEARYELAQALGRHGLDELARREWQLSARIGGLDSWYTNNAQQHLAREAAAAGRFLEAAERRERFMLPCLNTNTGFLDTTAYLRVPHRVHLDRARGLLATGKTEAALKEIQTCLSFLPAHVDTPILLVPALEKRGHKQEADKLFGKVLAHCEQLSTDYPRWAQAHNLLAWLCARCRRQLDQALTHAQKAVELSPKSAAYLDTLAEVHFQRGDQARAIDLMRRCIALESQRHYFRRQLQRFEAGDRSTDVPHE
jgi:tetratricopeptide (TPR) repeat protein